MQTKNLQSNLCHEVPQARQGRLWAEPGFDSVRGNLAAPAVDFENNVSKFLLSFFKLGTCSLSSIPFSLLLQYGQSYFLIILFVSNPVVTNTHSPHSL